jgi:hypothetical protein
MKIPDLTDQEVYQLKVALKLLRYSVLSSEIDTFEIDHIDTIVDPKIKARLQIITSLLEKLKRFQ